MHHAIPKRFCSYERCKIGRAEGSNRIYPDRGKSNPASTTSPHYSFGKLNASMQITCQRAAAPKTPMKEVRKITEKKQRDTHNRYMQIRLTQEEYEAIERKFRNSGLKSRSEFIRAMIFKWTYRSIQRK